MSKAFRKVEKTMSPPNCMRFERQAVPEASAAKPRKRAIAKRLNGSGRNLADATSNPKDPRS